jgi:predicted alpha-1,2-mannosidase
MRFTTKLFVLYVGVLIATSPTVVSQTHIVDLVDTRDGAAPPGNCFVGVSSPWGLVNAAIIERPMYSGRLVGVSTINIQGTGCHDGGLGHGVVRARSAPSSINVADDVTSYQITNSSAERLSIEYAGALHEATATRRVAFHRIVRTSTADRVVIDLGTGHLPARSVTLHTITDTSFSATLDVGGFCTHPFYKPIYISGVVKGATITTMLADGSTLQPSAHSANSILLEAPMRGDTVEVRLGLSLVRPENAQLNLEAEGNGVTFDSVCAAVRRAWMHEMNRIVTYGGTDQDRRKFHSLFYRTLQHPNIAYDVNGEFVQYDRNDVGQKTDYERTVLHDIWGHFQTNLGYYGMFMPDMARHVMKTLTEMTVEAGVTPQWDWIGRQLYIMNGDPFPLIVLDAVQNGTLSKDDLRRMYSTIIDVSGRTTSVRPQQWFIPEFGFIPSIQADGKRVMANVSNHMEYAMADVAIARFGQIIGDTTYAPLIGERAARLWNTFHPETGWFQPRRIDGTWSPDFSPDVQPDHEVSSAQELPFKEGSGREFFFFPQHLRHDLVERLGGWSAYAQRLDPLFNGELPPFIAHNQMQMHLPWQYLYIPDSAHRSQTLVRDAIERTFPVRNNVVQVLGNDDLGSTSAWFLLASMGLYPTLGFERTWLVTSPLFDSVHVRIRDDATQERLLRILSTGPTTAKHVSRVTVDGREVSLTHIDDDVLRAASVVVIERSEQPVRQPQRWNREVQSVSQHADSIWVLFTDRQRETLLEVEQWDRIDGHVLRDTVLAGVRQYSVAMNITPEAVLRVRDLADPSGMNAWVELVSSIRPPRVHEQVSLLELAPMPAQSYVSFRVQLGYEASEVVVYSITGAEVRRYDHPEGGFSISGLAPGAYLVRCTVRDSRSRSETRILTRPLIVHY